DSLRLPGHRDRGRLRRDDVSTLLPGARLSRVRPRHPHGEGGHAVRSGARAAVLRAHPRDGGGGRRRAAARGRAGQRPAAAAGKGIKPVATNRKAFHDYFVEDRAEAGLVLTGTEVKSLREGRAQLKDSFVQFRGGEAYLVGAHISPYGSGSWTNHPPERDRKLLMHRREIDRWA